MTLHTRPLPFCFSETFQRKQEFSSLVTLSTRAYVRLACETACVRLWAVFINSGLFFKENYNCRVTPTERVQHVKRRYLNIVNNFRGVSEGNANVSTCRRNGLIVVLCCTRGRRTVNRKCFTAEEFIDSPEKLAKTRKSRTFFRVRSGIFRLSAVGFSTPTHAAFAQLFHDPKSKDRLPFRRGRQRVREQCRPDTFA